MANSFSGQFVTIPNNATIFAIHHPQSFVYRRFSCFCYVFFVHAFDHVTILTNHFTPIILNYYLHFRQCKQHLGPNIWAVLCERYYRNLFEDLFLLKWFCHSYLTNEWLFLNPKLWTPHWIWKVDIFGEKEKEKECDSQPYH